MSHKTFDIVRPDREPITFDLGGQTFTCRPSISAGLLLGIGSSTDDVTGARSARALIAFLTGAVVAADAERFMGLLEDPEIAVPVETLGEIVEWLVDELTGHPTSPPSASSGGRRVNGPTSMAASRSAGSTTPNGFPRNGS